jgi:hypothetical protein
MHKAPPRIRIGDGSNLSPHPGFRTIDSRIKSSVTEGLLAQGRQQESRVGMANVIPIAQSER